MNILIKNGRVINPATGMDGISDLYVVDGLVAKSGRDLVVEQVDETIEASGLWVVPGQDAVEQLGDRARDFRGTLGRTLDELAADLSTHRGDLERLVARREDLSARRESARARLRAGEPLEGEADALLWELAAIEEEVRRKATQCDELESQVGELQIRLEHENEQLESEIAMLVQVLDADMARLEPMAAALRMPLERAEKYVRENWSRKPARA